MNMKPIAVLLLACVLTMGTAGCDGFPDGGKQTGDVVIGGVAYPADTERFVVSDANFSEYAALRQFSNLQTLDLTAQELDAEEYEAIRRTVGGDVQIVWYVPFDGEKRISTTPELHLSHEPTEDDIACAACFTRLEKVTVENSPLTFSLLSFVQAVRDENPECEWQCATSVYGVPIDSQTDILTLDNHAISDLTELKLALELFPHLQTVEMNECGLNDDIMGELREDYPEVTFVWTVHFLIYSLRTDAKCFSTLVAGGEPRGSEVEFAPVFRYCTELRALDLGHQYIADISEIRRLTKLQTLILADNRIEDISPLADLPDLNFVELFQNRISDVSPLTGLQHLEDLNIMYNSRITNHTELLKCKNLNRLYIAHCGLSAEDKQALIEGLPDGCELNTTNPNCVHGGWRDPEKVTAIRKAFKYWWKVKEYDRWDQVVFE